MPRTGNESRAAHDAELDEYLHLYTLNRGILMTPFHNMALMCPATSAADVDRHTEVFGAAVEELRLSAGPARAARAQESNPRPKRSSVRSQRLRWPPCSSACSVDRRVASIIGRRSGSGGNGSGRRAHQLELA